MQFNPKPILWFIITLLSLYIAELILRFRLLLKRSDRYTDTVVIKNIDLRINGHFRYQSKPVPET